MIEMNTNMIIFLSGMLVYIGGVSYCAYCLRGDGKCCKKDKDDHYNLINEGTDVATIDV